MHPESGIPAPVACQGTRHDLRLRVPLKRGGALVTLRQAWIEPLARSFVAPVSVHMGTLISGSEIRYTLDGSEPDATSALYDQPFVIDRSTRVRMAVFKDRKDPLVALEHSYTRANLSAPVIEPPGGGFDGVLKASLRAPGAPEGAMLRYTTDGTDPVEASAQARGDIEISETTMLKARVFVGGAEPGLVASAAFRKLDPRPPLPDISIADLDPLESTVGWGGEAKRNLSIQSNRLSLKGTGYDRGIGVSAVSHLVYALKPEYDAFVAVVGVDDEMKDYPEASVVFQVWVDEDCLHESPVLHRNEIWHICVKLPRGGQRLRLVATDAGDGINCDHADWADAGLTLRR